MFWWEHKQSETSRVLFDVETHITGGTHMQPTIGMSIFGESGHGRTRLEFRSIATSCGEYFIIWRYICCENVVFYVSPRRPKCNYLFLVMCIVWSISFYFWLWHCLVLGCCFFWLCDLMCRERFCVSPQRKRILFWCNSMAATTAIAWLGHIWESCSFVPCLWDSHVGAPVEFGYKLWNVLFWMRANCCVLARIAHLHADDCVFSDR